MATPWPEILLNELFRFWKYTYVDHNTNILQLKIKKTSISIQKRIFSQFLLCYWNSSSEVKKRVSA